MRAWSYTSIQFQFTFNRFSKNEISPSKIILVNFKILTFLNSLPETNKLQTTSNVNSLIYIVSSNHDLMISPCTHNYYCLFHHSVVNQSINPASYIPMSPSYNFDFSFLSRIRCSHPRTSPPLTVDIKVDMFLHSFQCRP